MLTSAKSVFCILFLAAISFACYRHPVPDDFDRYIYEALVRKPSESIETTYAIVKHENPRAESSTVLDSPQHLKELEPLYAIRPIYVAAISAVSHVLPIQNAINLISATSFFGVGLVVLFWTRNPLLTALLMAYYPVMLLGRYGTPDGLSALLVVPAVWLLRDNPKLALVLLVISLGVRTDNLLLLLIYLAWLAKERRWLLGSLGTAVFAIGTVMTINHWAGNYGWVVLFRYSFVGGRYPAQMPHVLTVSEYARALGTGLSVIVSHVTLWLLLGVVAWRRSGDFRLPLLGVAIAAHFLLFPSAEDRYFLWAFVAIGAIFIRSLDLQTGQNALDDRHPEFAGASQS